MDGWMDGGDCVRQREEKVSMTSMDDDDDNGREGGRDGMIKIRQARNIRNTRMTQNTDRKTQLEKVKVKEKSRGEFVERAAYNDMTKKKWAF